MSNSIVRCYFVLDSKNPAHQLVLTRVVELINGLNISVQMTHADINSLSPDDQIKKLKTELWENHKEICDLKRVLKKELE